MVLVKVNMVLCAFSLRASVEYDVRGSREGGSSRSGIFASCRKPTFIQLIEIIHFSNRKLSRIEVSGVNCLQDIF
jgi:tRNA (Thr-GGU) A37 N-methylase